MPYVPARGDHEARRRDVSAAVWRVLASQGFGGLTLRAVAAEMGVSTGLLTHYFPTKKALVRHALELAHEHTDGRDRRTPPAEGLAALRTALLDVLPLTAAAAEMSRVWIGFWDSALTDAELGAAELARYERWRGMLRPHVQAAVRLGELPAGTMVDDVVVQAAAFAHGLVVQALFDPARLPPERQIRLVDGFVGLLSAR
ncbi:TetR/AcrR family transcriptional regulator [Catellatospora sp. NPDC049609]|uniref:TetR/AcrR family transcriptional regulator n=1 Tax=Catellatospora sp. NPDC049609 TaxID=3155505 RepID=UPI00342D40F0